MTSRLWLPLVILLAIVIAVGGIIIWSRYDRLRAVELSLTDSPLEEAPYGQVYISGNVAAPGLYPLSADNSIPALLQAAGGTSADAHPGELRLYVGEDGIAAQKIDINRAEAWLLQALPGIGGARAAAIVGYRTEHGPFRAVEELTKVEGIGAGTLAAIRDLITVGD